MSKKLTCFVSFALVLALMGVNRTLAVEVDIRIVTGDDDVEEHVANGSMDLTSTDLELAYEDEGEPATDEQIIGLRFVNIPLPTGAQITSAYVEFEVDETKNGTDPVNLVIEGELALDAAPFTDLAYHLSNRTPLTTANVKWSVPDWTAADGKFQTPDISAVIQDILDQSGWAAGGALVLTFRDDTDSPSSGIRCAESYDGEPAAAPLLHITAEVKKAYSPDPADGAEYVTIPLVSWKPGDTAVFHEVYFGTNPTPGPDEWRVRQRLGMTMYLHSPLVAAATYYWRIDEVEADETTIHTGDVWTLTATPLTASNPDPPDGAKHVATDVVLSWYEGFTAITHDVYLGTDETEVTDGTGGTFKGNRPGATYPTVALQPDTTYYWRIDEVDSTETHTGDIWSFRTIPDRPISDPNLIGWWKLDESYAGTTLDWSGYDNNGTVIGDPQWVDGVMDGALELDGDDFVRVDDVADDIASNNITLSGWVKTTDADADWFSCNDSGRGNTDCVRFGIQGGNAYVYDDGTDEAHTTATVDDGEWHMLTYVRDGLTGYVYVDARLENTHPADFNVVDATNLWSIGQEWDSGGPSDFLTGTIDDVRFYDRPLTQPEIVEVTRGDLLLAWNPKPAHGSTPDIEQVTPLGWSPGDRAAKHHVYFGTDQAGVANANTTTTGIYRGRRDPNTYTPPEALEFGRTYYWRIDEYNTDATISQGRLWSFTVADYLIVEDFEAYDDVNDRIFYTWKGGYGYTGYCGNGTGSVVGHATAPFAEQTIVHGGEQSLPYFYDNTGTGTNFCRQPINLYYSEVQRTWETPQDWTRHDVKALTLWFRGYPASVGSFSYDPVTGIYTMTADGADIWNVPDFPGAGAGNYHDEFHYAFKQLSGVATIEAQVLSVQNTDAWAKAGVMIRETLDPNSPHAMVVITPANGVAFQYRGTPGGTSTNVSQTGITAPHWVRISRSANTFTGEHSADRITWETIDTANIPMAAEGLIGLALTSHNTDPTVACTAEFSDVATTGTVTGNWQSQDIGIASNVAEQLYVAVEDSAGKREVAKHLDPNAALADTWQEWNIDLKQFTDALVNIRSVKKMYIGVGDKAAPKLGGAGTLYVDNIRLYRSRCLPDLAKPAADFSDNCVVDYPDLEIMANEWLLDLVTFSDVAGVWFEAESANTMTDPLQTFSDRADASGGQYIAVEPGNNSTADPPTDGHATYVFYTDVGVYKIIARVVTPTTSDDSFWFRIQGATTNTNNHSSGWVRWTAIDTQFGTDWHWDEVHSNDDNNQTVHFTLARGTHTLEIAYREDGALLDAFIITDDLNFDQRNLLPRGRLDTDLNADNKIGFKDYAILAGTWLDELLWP